MNTSRRSLAAGLAGLAAAPLLSLPARAQLASAAPAVGPALRDRYAAALAALPSNHRGYNALSRSLERLDDMALNMGTGRFVLVNPAAQEVVAYQDGAEVLRSRVIVGTTRTRTPQMTTFLTTVRFHPPWYVPTSIIPEIRAQGAAGFQAVGNRLIQPPGPTNPLGPLRLGLFDSDGIFLHGTNRPAYFARQSRALSHGCVRVEKVRELAAWMLDWDLRQVQSTLATGRTQDILPLQDVQVAIAYLTVWPDQAGQLIGYPDIYGYDAPGTRLASVRRVFRPTQGDIETARAPTEDNPL
ncbi:L,D-transpeptidase family protein [Roseococcus sp. YIM B11640]|uniref:L,D-transpeptidase family protein n=1 Tax=Roseococcus sp. YIM B11640 TaxID=3133973 RepID=UPI003C7ECC5F